MSDFTEATIYSV